jgi:hypothetical protein
LQPWQKRLVEELNDNRFVISKKWRAAAVYHPHELLCLAVFVPRTEENSLGEQNETRIRMVVRNVQPFVENAARMDAAKNDPQTIGGTKNLQEQKVTLFSPTPKAVAVTHALTW